MAVPDVEALSVYWSLITVCVEVGDAADTVISGDRETDGVVDVENDTELDGVKLLRAVVDTLPVELTKTVTVTVAHAEDVAIRVALVVALDVSQIVLVGLADFEAVALVVIETTGVAEKFADPVDTNVPLPDEVAVSTADMDMDDELDPECVTVAVAHEVCEPEIVSVFDIVCVVVCVEDDVVVPDAVCVIVELTDGCAEVVTVNVASIVRVSVALGDAVDTLDATLDAVYTPELEAEPEARPDADDVDELETESVALEVVVAFAVSLEEGDTTAELVLFAEAELDGDSREDAELIALCVGDVVPVPVTGVGICGVVHAVAEAEALRVYGLLITVVVALMDAADTVATGDELVEELDEVVGVNVVETVSQLDAAVEIDAACGEPGGGW